ncbi:hypothetical protein [Variovorax sp. PAMC 28711]|uniref:hypothetical protein n=1 Tax=Variovorax sp. PAMC 28711 TaxID=1795631 RepID=UPI00078BD8F1|nr:hypothetical protein [Variovorax sp. PAMC 28711]AMM22986.1 hypothetical protein AX767_00275 [Variovorax sp. PAMC 28711]
MSWAAVGGAAVGLVGSALSSDKNGGAGAQQQTQTKTPWAPATPWLMSNIEQGQNLQNQYQKNPFSARQTAAYDNSYGLSQYARALVPDLLGQISNQPLGYNKLAPLAKPNAYNFNGAGNGTGGGGSGGLLGLLSAQAPVAEATSIKQLEPEAPKFTQQGDNRPIVSNWNNTGGDAEALMAQMFPKTPETPWDSVGSYGSFKYGMDMPKPGTQAYKDMSEYFAYGGADPMNKYGRGASVGGGLLGGGYGGFGAADGGNGSTGGSAASDGSGGGGPAW